MEEYNKDNVIEEKTSKVECNVCFKTYANKHSLTSHKNRYHNKTISKKQIDNFNPQMEEYIKENAIQEKTSKVECDEEQTFKVQCDEGETSKVECDVCYKTYRNRHSLAAHERRFHSIKTKPLKEELDNLLKIQNEHYKMVKELSNIIMNYEKLI